MEALNVLPSSVSKTIDLYQVAEIQLSYKTKVVPAERPKVCCSDDAYSIFMQHWDNNSIELREEFKMLVLNRANKVLGINTISVGGVSGTVVDPKLVFSTALLANASTIIVAHNHPSGNLKPSQQDLSMTKKLVDGGKLLEISLLDHLILTVDGYTSMANDGLLN